MADFTVKQPSSFAASVAIGNTYSIKVLHLRQQQRRGQTDRYICANSSAGGQPTVTFAPTAAQGANRPLHYRQQQRRGQIDRYITANSSAGGKPTVTLPPTAAQGANRPILRGRDIKRYEYEWANLWIIATFPSQHYDIENYPAVKNYLFSIGIERLEQTGEAHIINEKK